MTRRVVTSACCLLGLASGLAAAEDPRKHQPSYFDLPYVENGHPRQRLDLYLPASGDGPFPVILWVHGGAWRVGDKGSPPAASYVVNGYAVVAINYRLSQHAHFPAQLVDCKSAVRWIRAHAEDYRLDPDRIAAWGASAGGHLAALLGVTGDRKEFDQGGHLGQSSAVQAVVDYFGPTDFLKMNSQAGGSGTIDHDAPGSPESQLVGGPVQENPEKANLASPLRYVTRDAPPFLIVHGDRDRLVPIAQSVLLERALGKAGVPVRLYTVEGAGHGRFSDPSVGEVTARFLAKHLDSGGAE